MSEFTAVVVGVVLFGGLFGLNAWAGWRAWRRTGRPWPTRLNGLAVALWGAGFLLTLVWALVHPLQRLGPLALTALGLLVAAMLTQAAAWYTKERDRRFQARLAGRPWLLPPPVVAAVWIAGVAAVDLVVGLAAMPIAERTCTNVHSCEHTSIAMAAVLVTLTAVGVLGAITHAAIQAWRHSHQDGPHAEGHQ